MRLFQKPKPNGAMPKSEDIFRDPKELEALKAKVKPEEYLKALYDKIFFAEKGLEKRESDFKATKIAFEEDFEKDKARKEQEIVSLENTLGIKRAEYAQLSKPFIDRSSELDWREVKLIEREKSSSDEMQKAFHMEHEATNKLADVQSLSDQLGETQVRQLVKEESLKNLEKTLKHNENQYLLKVERFSHEVNESAALIQERENAILLKELNVQGKEENLIKREKELSDGRTWLTDQREVLRRAWAELNRKQNDKSTTTHITSS